MRGAARPEPIRIWAVNHHRYPAMTRSFKIQITEITTGCIPSHPMTIEVPADSVSAAIQILAALPLDGVDLVPLPRNTTHD